MSTPVPPSPPPPAAAPSGTPAATVTVSQAPEALLRLPPGETLEVRLLARVAAAMARANAGPDLPSVTLRLPPSLPPLPDSTTLLLQMVGARGDTAQLRLTAIDGKPLPQALADLAAQARLEARPAPLPLLPGTPSGAAPATAPAPGAVSVAVGQGSPLEAVVLRAPPQGLPLTGGAQTPLLQGSPLTLRLLPLPPQAGGSPPAAGPVPTAPAAPTGGVPASTGPITPPTPGTAAPVPPSPATATPATGGGAGGGAAAPQAPTTGQPAPQTPAGAPAQTPTSTPTLAGGQAPPPAPASPAPQGAPTPGGGTTPPPGSAGQGQGAAPTASQGQTATQTPGRLTGVVAPATQGGPTLVRVGEGLIALTPRVDLAAGTRVSLEVVGRAPPPALPAAAPSAPLAQPLAALPPGPTASAWPTLSESLDLLGRTDPQAGRQLSNAIPGADQRLLTNTLTYMAAVRLGDARPWLGENPLRALERAGPRGRFLSQQLGKDVQELGLRSRDSGGGDWRVLQMPFGAGPTIDRIEIITRRTWAREMEEDDEEQRRKGGGGGGQRFLVNVTLSATGPLQIDGLYTKARRKLDIVVRTHTPLPDAMQADIQRLHARNAAAIDMAGGVTFDVAEHFPGPEDDGDHRTILA